MGDGGAALGAEQAVHVLARAASLCVALDGAGEVHLVLGDDADERYRCRSATSVHIDYVAATDAMTPVMALAWSQWDISVASAMVAVCPLPKLGRGGS